MTDIEKTEKFVQDVMAGDSTGHDYFHVQRVRNMARKISWELCNPFIDHEIVDLACLLHDVADRKLVDDVELAKVKIVAHLGDLDIIADKAARVLNIIDSVSWGSGKVMTTLEGAIVQDADRLDALGAIGIARCFAYGGHVGRPIYDPKDLFTTGRDRDQKGKSSIAHFYDKLLVLESKMNTEPAMRIARKRTIRMETFLHQFFLENDGE